MQTAFTILVFQSTYLTYKAERTLKKADVPCRLVTKPRHVTSDCGLAIRLEEGDSQAGLALLAAAAINVMTIC